MVTVANVVLYIWHCIHAWMVVHLPDLESRSIKKAMLFKLIRTKTKTPFSNLQRKLVNQTITSYLESASDLL